MTTLQADKTIDCSGELCPGPVFELAQGIKQVNIGQIVKLVATDPGSQQDMQAWSQQTGHALLDAHTEDKKFVFYFRREK